MGLIDKKYGKTRLEEVEELIMEWMNFRANDYEEEDDFLLEIEKLHNKKSRYGVNDKEWFSVWMMIETRKRKGLESFQLEELRKVVKAGGEEVIGNYREKYKELRMESNRGKTAEAFYMGNQSLARTRYNSQRNRTNSYGRDYQRIRKDSKGERILSR